MFVHQKFEISFFFFVTQISLQTVLKMSTRLSLSKDPAKLSVLPQLAKPEQYIFFIFWQIWTTLNLAIQKPFFIFRQFVFQKRQHFSFFDNLFEKVVKTKFSEHKFSPSKIFEKSVKLFCFYNVFHAILSFLHKSLL